MAARLCQSSSYGRVMCVRTLPTTPATPRYRYYSTPVIPPRNSSHGKLHGGHSHPQQRRAHAAAQLARPPQSLPHAIIRPPGSSRSRAALPALSPHSNDALEEMERAFASAEIDCQPTSRPHVQSSLASRRKRTTKPRDHVAPSMRNVAEQPWLQPDDDSESKAEVSSARRSQQLDWRGRALSRLPKSAIPKRIKRTKPPLTEHTSDDSVADAILHYRTK